MKRSLLVAAVLFSAGLCRADIVLETTDNSRLLCFQEEGRVFYEPCPKGGKTERGCSGKPRAELFSTDVDRFVRSVQSFYGVVDPLYSGVRGGQELAAKIRGLQEHLDHDEFTAKELQRAETALLGYIRIGDKLEQADRELLKFLGKEFSTTLNSEYQNERYRIVNLAYFMVGFTGPSHKLYRLTEPVTFDKVSTVCQAFDDTWSAVVSPGNFEPELRDWLAMSPVVPIGQVTRVWTTLTTAGYYSIMCNNQYSRTGKAYEYKYSPKELHDKEEAIRTDHLGFTGICGDPHYTWEESRTFVQGTAVTVDLGAVSNKAGNVIEPVEVGENVVASTTHPVLCQRGFEFDPLDGETPYLNGEHFTDFSIYHLERSFEAIAKSVYANRADFFRAVSKTLGEFPLRDTDDIKVGFHTAGARLFVLLAVEPLLHDIQSKFVDNFVLPDYNRAKELWSKRLGAATLGEIDLSPPTYRLALTLLTYGLKASQSFLNADDKKTAEELLPVLGKALAAGPNGLAELVPVLQAKRVFFDHVTAARRVHGFGVMGTAISEYLIHKGGAR